MPGKERQREGEREGRERGERERERERGGREKICVAGRTWWARRVAFIQLLLVVALDSRAWAVHGKQIQKVSEWDFPQHDSCVWCGEGIIPLQRVHLGNHTSLLKTVLPVTHKSWNLAPWRFLHSTLANCQRDFTQCYGFLFCYWWPCLSVYFYRLWATSTSSSTLYRMYRYTTSKVNVLCG